MNAKLVALAHAKMKLMSPRCGQRSYWRKRIAQLEAELEQPKEAPNG